MPGGGREECRWCGGMAERGSTCPRSVPCPTCHAAAGASCARPSGHRAAELHAGRVALAESGVIERARMEAAPQLRMDADDQTAMTVEVAADEARKEAATCSCCLARTYRGEECVCPDGGDAEQG